MLNKIFFLAANSVQSLIRLCGVDKRFRALCADEYVWLHMYFLKVRGKTELSQIANAQEARNAVMELRATDGQDWETAMSYEGSTFALALIALLWYTIAAHGNGTKSMNSQLQNIGARTKPTARMTTSASVPGQTVFWRNADWEMEAKVYRPANWRPDMVMMSSTFDLFTLLQERGLQLELSSIVEREVDGEPMYRLDIPNDERIHLFVLLLQMDFIPSLERETRTLPTMLTEACIACGFPAALVQCGAECGRAHYCDQVCADAHWETHRTNCHH
jgi:hypothetical protein